MKNISLLPHRFDVRAAGEELRACDAWNMHPFRTGPTSPHREVEDIWVRYNAIENLGPHFNDPHEAVWYPVAKQLPAVRGLIDQVLEQIKSEELGGVLVTRIHPGKQVYPHIDRGWHAEHYEKFAVLVEGNEEQSFCYEDGEFHCQEGDAFTFNNQASHWVLNPTDQARMTLIICARRS